MKALTLDVQVKLSEAKGFETHRVAGFLDDGETVAVATMRAGDRQATPEFQFVLGDAVALAEQCLAGDRRALTTPGLARILSATVALLFRVSIAGGSIQTLHEDAGAHGHRDDRDEAAADEDPD